MWALVAELISVAIRVPMMDLLINCDAFQKSLLSLSPQKQPNSPSKDSHLLCSSCGKTFLFPAYVSLYLLYFFILFYLFYLFTVC